MIPFAIRSRSALAAVLMTGVLAGCSPSDGLSPVTGTVSFDGQPVKEGRITFKAGGPSGRAYSGEIKDGRYSIKAEPGTMIVEVTASRLIPGKFDKSNGTPEPVGEMYIPAKYNSATTLTAEVKASSNEIPFALTK